MSAARPGVSHRGEPGRDTGAVDSFYPLADGLPAPAVCRGVACFVARHRKPSRWSETNAPSVHCLGQCFSGPAAASDSRRPAVEVHSREGIVLGRIAAGGARSLAAYRARGGYRALESAVTRGAEPVLQAVEVSELRGRGGAGFPTGRKWRAFSAAVRSAGSGVIIANADEGDPGAYIDRFLMEDDPFALIEGLTLAALASGARQGWIYLRAEYPAARRILEASVGEALDAGYLGPRILGNHFEFDLRVFPGKGSYVCGEETALIQSMEGRRGEVQARPPHPTQQGFQGWPTLINNVETLVNLPWIVQHGGEAYRALGFSRSRGTKAVSLNSLFRRPGLYEVEFGVTVRHLVEELGGGLGDGSSIEGVLLGGPLAGIIPPSLFDTPLGFEELGAIGAGVGHGGLVAFDARTSPAELAREISRFAADESCGKCTPCRLGCRRMEELFARASTPAGLEGQGAEEARQLGQVLKLASLCGHGRGLGEFINSVWRHYGERIVACP